MVKYPCHQPAFHEPTQRLCCTTGVIMTTTTGSASLHTTSDAVKSAQALIVQEYGYRKWVHFFLKYPSGCRVKIDRTAEKFCHLMSHAEEHDPAMYRILGCVLCNTDPVFWQWKHWVTSGAGAPHSIICCRKDYNRFSRRGAWYHVPCTSVD